VVEVNFDDPASVDRALSGAWGAFSVQNSWEAGVEREEQQGKAFAERARKQGVQHYVYNSVGSANRKTGIPHFDSKGRVEEWFERVGYDAQIDTLERIYGIKLTSFRDWAAANRSVLVCGVSPGYPGSGVWQTASMLWPSGSSTNAP
jgi:hypothetical protein